MATEIERKFLVNSTWEAASSGTRIVQAYLIADKSKAVRIRISGDTAYLTVKGPTHGISRPEYEYQIPLLDAQGLLDLCGKPYLEKTRYLHSHEGKIWEIDVFAGENQGLVIAEVEISNEEEEVNLPSWVGEEVSNDPRYINANLLKNPYLSWTD